MGNGIRKKYCHKIVHGISRKRVKSDNKYKNTIDCYIMLLKKQQKQGLTKWIANEKEKVYQKFKKYGITDSMVKDAIEAKGLKDLLTLK